ncbi:hypothetical protein N7481_008089 [Penicillium waksmanii]|uniref:uncharacterized protein n=1 Tax=Penicillium waksmanii TaxID=69791 RepID=UPI002547B324|nr:uncharacterized protein N7481_008089 [Penicillium waksmanii]KAJ5980791.1 hypothetical protein N7481_008089 [Penicillium waksmanii]
MFKSDAQCATRNGPNPLFVGIRLKFEAGTSQQASYALVRWIHSRTITVPKLLFRVTSESLPA